MEKKKIVFHKEGEREEETYGDDSYEEEKFEEVKASARDVTIERVSNIITER